MRLAYQTNTWGGVFGHPAGVTSVKDLYYLANGSTEEALRDIAAAGYSGCELFDGNLMQYADREDDFRGLMEQHGLELVGVYSGANFIYPDILAEELAKIANVAALAARLGAEHLVVGGGAIHSTGNTDEDYERLGQGLDRVAELAARHGLTPSFHPHLGTTMRTASFCRSARASSISTASWVRSTRSATTAGSPSSSTRIPAPRRRQRA
jgi:inosose dehydratase